MAHGEGGSWHFNEEILFFPVDVNVLSGLSGSAKYLKT